MTNEVTPAAVVVAPLPAPSKRDIATLAVLCDADMAEYTGRDHSRVRTVAQ
jgi:hypothetical protein